MQFNWGGNQGIFHMVLNKQYQLGRRPQHQCLQPNLQAAAIQGKRGDREGGKQDVSVVSEQDGE